MRMTKDEAEQTYKNAEKKLARMRALRHEGKIGEELIELRKMLMKIFEVGDPWTDIIHDGILHEFGVAHQNLGDYPQALDYLWSAAILRKKYPVDLFYTLHQIVMCKLARGDKSEDVAEDIVRARESYESAVAYAEKKYDYRDLGYMHHNYAIYFHRERKYDDALLYYSISEGFFSKTNDSRGQALSFLRQAQCFIKTGDSPEAEECLDFAKRVFSEIGDKKRLEEVKRTREEIKKF